MNIQQNHSVCKSAGGELDNISLSGNIVPHNWYHQLTRAGGKADTVAIAILSELVFLHRYQGDREFQLKFSYFKHKFNFGLSQVKAGIVRLEKVGLVKRDLRTVRVYNRVFNNELFLILNVAGVLKLTEHSGAKKFALGGTNGDEGYDENSADNNDKKYLRKKSRSNLEKNNLNKNSKQLELATHTTDTADLNLTLPETSSHRKDDQQVQITPEAAPLLNILKPNSYSKITQVSGKKLAEFHPLTQDDADFLTSKSGRNFDLNFINQLMQRLATKYSDRKFFSKNSVLNYMSKILLHEIRDAVQVSNGNFKFGDTSKQSTKEKYLQTIEDSLATDNLSRLKRKIAGIFHADVAYPLINGANYKVIANNKLVITTATTLELTINQQDLLLQQVQSVYGDHIRYLDITISQNVQTTKSSSRQPQVSQEDETKTFEGIWGKIRQGLIDYYGSGGNTMDSAWFSKLTAEVDSDAKKLTLKAESKFIKDWVQSNYAHLIAKLCRLESYSLEEVLAV